MQTVIDDCPDCQAARARGERPLTLTADQLLAGLPRAVRRRIERERARTARRASRGRR